MLIILGLLISIPIMVFGSQLILKAMERFPWLVYLGSGVLAWAAAKMIFEEKAIAPWMAGRDYVEAVAKIAIVAAVLLLGYLQRKRNAKQA